MPRAFLRASAVVVLGALFTVVPPLPATGKPTASKTAQSADETEPERAATDGTGKVWYEKVVVTATRSPEQAGRIPLYTTVLEREDILSAPAPETLDLLRELPSIDFSRDSNTLVAQPRDQAISFRGMVGSVQSRALTLVDGVPIVDPYGGWLNFGEVPKELVDRIEVVRGGGSSAWGNLALSGVINLITRAPSSRELGGTFRAGDRSTGAADLYYTDAGSRWEGWIAGDALTTDGWIDAAAPYRGAADEALFRSTRSLHGRLGYTLSPSTHVTFRGMLYRDHQGQGLATDRADYRESSGAATLDQVRSDRSSWQLQVFHRRLGESSTAGNLSLDHQSVEPSNAVVALPERSSGVGGTWSSTLGAHALTAGADVVENRIERVEDLKWDGSIYTSRYDVRGEQRLGGVFVQDAITLSSRASVQVGARFDRVWSGDATSVRSSLITGEITGSVNNFRFNESPVDLLNRFSHASATEPAFSREWGDDYFSRTAMPALRVPDFNMSSVSQAM